MFKVYARAIILDNQQRILLIKKNSHQKISPGAWMIPGWTLEFWEDIEDMLCREVLEEVGLRIISHKFITTQKMIIGDTHWIGLYYLCTTKDLVYTNMEPEKHEKVDWIGMDKLPDMVDKELIKKVLINLSLKLDTIKMISYLKNI